MKPKRLIEALVVHIARLVDGSMLMERRAGPGTPTVTASSPMQGKRPGDPPKTCLWNR